LLTYAQYLLGGSLQQNNKPAVKGQH
jgi:hypothetical protein